MRHQRVQQPQQQQCSQQKSAYGWSASLKDDVKE